MNKIAEVKWLGFLLLMFFFEACFARDISVSTNEQLAMAFRQALPGTRILILPGNYSIYRLDTFAGGTAQQPIVVEGISPDSVTVKATGSEAISVHHPFWIFKDLTITGGAGSSHAFHITNNADNVVINNNRIVDFHTQIKVNGENGGFPDNGLIEGNDIYNFQTRLTDEPVTAIDIVGGRNWVVRDNYVADFSKELGDKTSYGIFMKGNSVNGLIERNLVICSKGTAGGTRIGVSFGGGGSDSAYCENQDCSVEHSNGMMRNNVILNCSDVGIYLNRAKSSNIEHNTLLMTLGIDVRYPQSTALIKNNILTGSVRERDGGKSDIKENVILGTSLGMWLPALSNKLQHRISDYHIKFPSLISGKDIEEYQGLIGNLFSFLQKTWLGLGEDKTRDCFPGLVMGNLKPDENECGVIWEGDEASSDVMEDFWGNKRSTNHNVMGAIDFYQSTCDILGRVQHKSSELSSVCMDY